MRLKPGLPELIVLSAVLLLAAYLRLANLADNPGWYTDEGTHLDIARNLLQGCVQYLAIGQSTLLAARPPLFELLLSVLLGLFGGGIGALRAFTGTLGIIAVGLLYLVIRRVSADRGLALLAAALLAIYPPAVLYSRFGFSYNLLTPLVLLIFLGLWGYLSSTRRRWLALAAFAIGLGIISDVWMLAMIAPLALVVSVRQWRDGLWCVPLALLPLGLYAGVMLVATPQAFLFDVRFALSRMNTLPPGEQIRTLALNYSTLVAQDGWLALALVGLLMLRPARLQRLSLFLSLLPLVLVGRAVALYSLSFYYMIPLLPFAGLGLANLIRRGAPMVARAIDEALAILLRHWGVLSDRVRRVGVSVALACLMATPFITSTLLTIDQVRDRFNTAIDPFLLDPPDARAAADFVNRHVQPRDVVIASPGLAWLVQANVADFQMSIAARGQATPHLPADVPPDRFVFDPGYTRARYVIVDNLWRNWAEPNVPGVPEMLRDVETWPLAFKSGPIEVYANPR